MDVADDSSVVGFVEILRDVEEDLTAFLSSNSGLQEELGLSRMSSYILPNKLRG